MAADLPESDRAERKVACTLIEDARGLRTKYVRRAYDLVCASADGDLNVEFQSGVARITHNKVEVVSVPSLEEFGRDYAQLLEIVAHGPVRTFAHSRLEVLSFAFRCAANRRSPCCVRCGVCCVGALQQSEWLSG